MNRKAVFKFPDKDIWVHIPFISTEESEESIMQSMEQLATSLGLIFMWWEQ